MKEDGVAPQSAINMKSSRERGTRQVIAEVLRSQNVQYPMARYNRIWLKEVRANDETTEVWVDMCLTVYDGACETMIISVDFHVDTLADVNSKAKEYSAKLTRAYNMLCKREHEAGLERKLEKMTLAADLI